MYCISLGTKKFELAKKEILLAEMAEIRLDLTRFDHAQMTELCKIGRPLIFTYRKTEVSDDEIRTLAFETAIEQQAAWIDVDISEEEQFINRISEKIKAGVKTRLILSYHNYSHCPTNEKLYDIIIRAMKFYPDLIKIACFSHGIRDNKRILSFNRDFSNMIAFCMGEKGKSTRPLSLLMGAPFCYVALQGEPTAPGQMTVAEIEKMKADISLKQANPE